MNSAVIVAAGRGTRFGPDRDKLFLEVGGLPVVGHTWRTWDAHPEVDEIVIVARGGMETAFEALAGKLGLGKPYRIVPGGTERQDSVWNGLQAVSSGSVLVSIQDGARPCTSAAVITSCHAAARQSGAAVAAQRVTDTIKESDDASTISRHLDRSRLWSVQTPQTFQVEVLRRALQAVKDRGIQVTDDTAACECIGQRVILVPSSTPNPKVTLPDDLPVVELLLRAQVGRGGR